MVKLKTEGPASDVEPTIFQIKEQISGNILVVRMDL
jgi:hypothetical protein